MGPTRAQLIEVVEPAVNAAGYDLVEVEFRREPHAFVLRVFIDLLEAEAGVAGGVTVADCERASRTVSAALDVADPITVKYSLEVSSPGLDRPLRRLSDYRKFAGRRARLKLHDPVEGRRNFAGVLRDAADGIVHIEADGREFALPHAAIIKAHLEYDL
ncbi:MAG: ribosome maturation factor RimP [Deltaproteobacteria bacterium]|nr:ribosome maturation factor RimP [Deltaproteobacteria bacterium]